MTVPLSPGSPRRMYAQRFGAVLREAMERVGIGSKTLAPQIPCAPSAIGLWRRGDNLPTLKTAAKVAEALQEPRLLEIVRESRQGVCEKCGRLFYNEGGAPKRYCSSRCRDDRNRAKMRQYDEAADLTFAKEIERLANGPGRVRKADLKAAAAAFRAARPRRTYAKLERRLDLHAAAVERFCRSCEWDGICKTPECELRVVSPLPLAPDLELPEPAMPAEGTWGPSHRERQLEAVRKANKERWSRPGERERQAKSMAEFWATMTPAQRVEHLRKISEARKGKANIRSCGCPNRGHKRECPLHLRRTAA